VKLRPEAELVVLCVSPAQASTRITELLDGTLDWDAVFRFMGSQRLQQQVYWRLTSIRPDAVPRALEHAFQETLRNSLLLTRELVHVVELLGERGIDALPFKGPTLAIKAYGNLAKRSFDDLDVLVRVEDVWRARDVLQKAGFVPKVKLNPDRETDFLGAYDEFLLRGPDGFPLVELHWGFVPPHFGVNLEFEDCWQRRERLTLANRVLPSLAAEDLLLVLSVHGAKHGWSYLGLVTDLAWLIASHPMRWDAVLDRARKMGVLRMLLLGVALTEVVFGLEPDAATAGAMAADADVAVLACQLTESIFELNGRVPHDERAIARSAVLHMRMRERLRDRVRYALRLSTRAGIEDWEAIDLPGSLSFLYPLLRYPRLALKYRSRVPSSRVP
jgi:hypothetical protein